MGSVEVCLGGNPIQRGTVDGKVSKWGSDCQSEEVPFFWSDDPSKSECRNSAG